MNSAFQTAKSVAKAAQRHYYARNHIKAARKKLAGLEQAYGPLNPTDRKLCDDYAIEVLGHRRYAPWLYVYAHVWGKFAEGWIADNFYDECVLRHTSAAYGELSGLRSLNTRLFDAPEFPDLASQVNGMITDRNGKPVASKDLFDLLFSKSDRVVFKGDATQSGIGVKILHKASFDPGQLGSLGSGVFQEFIRQNELFERLGNSPAVATLRLTTAGDDAGRISLRGAYLRFGQAGMDYLLSSEEVNAVVDLSTGELGETGYLPSYLRIDRHPDAGIPFAGHSIPNYQECVRVALRCHARLPQVRCIGWDMCVDAEGAVKIMEWNGGHNGIKFTEATQGPSFADLNWQRFRR